MADICERRVVRRPERDASHCLAAFIGEHRVRDGKVHVALRLPFRNFATRKSPIERRVIATFYPLQPLGDEHSTYSVSWSAQGGGPFPEFAGALAVEKLPCDDCFGLILSGHYEPPLGSIGALFDAILGHRIAHGSTQDLLRSIAAHAEKASGPAVAMSRTRETPREKAARVQVTHRATVPSLALPFDNAVIRHWNQLDGPAVNIVESRSTRCVHASSRRDCAAATRGVVPTAISAFKMKFATARSRFSQHPSATQGSPHPTDA